MVKRPGIVIHCADTPWDMDIGAETIRKWHMEEREWSDIGYHYVIRRDGTVETGRPLVRDGAHAKGYNNYIGICMVGGKAKDGRLACNFTSLQFEALADLVAILQDSHGIPNDKVIGHNEVSDKACPTFDVRAWVGG